MARVSEETIRDIIQANPVEDVVGQYVSLRPDGRNLKALCPFHQEKTPSFKVHPAKQIYRCYGCGQAGNVIGFVMAMEKVDFLGAVKLLAARAGIAVAADAGVSSDLVEQARRANELACVFYQEQLNAGGFGAAAREYLVKRGFDREAHALFRLGASPDSWDALYDRLRRERISAEAMLEAGLIRPRKQGGGYYDYFRQRVMFPIIDVQGRVVGFGARTLGQDEPKYLNSPETRFFHKGKILYGAHLALDVRRTGRRVILVEGYTDVMMAVMNGVEGVVACLGTALTRENARELKRYTETVVLVYDGDEAGFRAAERALGPLFGQGLGARIVLLPGGQDPCDFIRERGGSEFLALVDQAEEAVPFLVRRAASLDGTDSPAALRRAIARCLTPLEDVDDPLMRELLRKNVASAFGVSESVLRGACPRARDASASRAAQGVPPSPYLGSEAMLVAALIADPATGAEVSLPERFEDPVLGEIAASVRRGTAGGGGMSLAALQAAFAGTAAGAKLVEILGFIEEFDEMKELVDWRSVARASGDEIYRKNSRQEGKAVKELLAAAQRQGDREAVRQLLARYQTLSRQAKGRSGELAPDTQHAEEVS
jgi:DNA primase